MRESIQRLDFGPDSGIEMTVFNEKLITFDDDGVIEIAKNFPKIR